MDSNIDNVRKNKLLIATAIKKEIDMLIIMTSNGRFDESDQNTLRMLNDWTAGGLWANTVLTLVCFLLYIIIFETKNKLLKFIYGNFVFRFLCGEPFKNNNL